ncbi:MAG: ABC transporter permease [Candidatus Binatia bacterium]
MSSSVPAQTWRKFRWGGRQNIVPVVGVSFALWLILIPLATLIIFSFRLGSPWDPGGYTLEHYIDAYTNPQTYSMFFNTAALAVFSTVLSVAIAVFFAFLTERTDMPFRNLAWGLMLVPMAIPGLLFAVSWTFLLSPRIGLFNIWLRGLFSLFGVEVTEGPLNIYSLWGMVLLEGLRGVTTIFLIIVGSFRAMDPNLEEAARVSGASNRTTFFRVFIPLLTPAILAAGMYSFMTHLESLEIPLVIGLPANIHVFPSYIFYTTQRYTPPQYGLSASLGASFLLVSIFLVYCYRRVLGQAGRFATITGKGYRPRIIRLGKWRYAAFFLLLLYFILTIGAPSFALFWSSILPVYLTPSWEVLPDLTLEHYREIFADRENLDATINTILVAVGAATLTMVLSLIIAWVIIRKRFKGKALLDGITFLPHSLPGVIIAIAFIFLYVQPPLNHLKLYGTIWIIMLGLTVGYLAFGSRTMIGALAQIHVEMEEAGQVSGAKWITLMRRIILPLLLPAFISGWIWVASHSLRNLSIPLMLASRESRVLSVIMWNTWEDGYPGQTSAWGVLLIVALAVLTVGGRWLVSRLSRQQEP